MRLSDPKSFEANVAANPLGRMARPEEIADAVVFLHRPELAWDAAKVVAAIRGVSRTDADYFPLIGLMPVTVKIRFEFISADNAPGRRLLTARPGSGGGDQLAQHIVEDAAGLEVLDLVEGVDAAQHFDAFPRAVLAADLHG